VIIKFVNKLLLILQMIIRLALNGWYRTVH